MRVFFDSSALLAALVEDEPAHQRSCAALSHARDGYVAAHSLAECFAGLTGGRLAARLTPREAAQVIRVSVFERLSTVTLTGSETLAVIESAGPLGVRGGAVYDLLLLAAARKASAARILTLNVRHFEAFAPDLRDIIAAP